MKKENLTDIAKARDKNRYLRTIGTIGLWTEQLQQKDAKEACRKGEKCPTSEELAALIDDQVSADKRQQLFEHLAECPGCYEEWLTVSAALRQERKAEGLAFLTSKKLLKTTGSAVAIAACLLFFLNVPPNTIRFHNAVQQESKVAQPTPAPVVPLAKEDTLEELTITSEPAGITVQLAPTPAAPAKQHKASSQKKTQQLARQSTEIFSSPNELQKKESFQTSPSPRKKVPEEQKIMAQTKRKREINADGGNQIQAESFSIETFSDMVAAPVPSAITYADLQKELKELCTGNGELDADNLLQKIASVKREPLTDNEQKELENLYSLLTETSTLKRENFCKHWAEIKEEKKTGFPFSRE